MFRVIKALLLTLSVVVILGIVGLYFFGESFFEDYFLGQAKDNITQARALAEEDHYDSFSQALEKARQAQEALPEDPDVLRLMYDLYENYRPAIALQIIEPVVLSEVVTLEEKIRFLKTATRIGRIDLAKSLLARLQDPLPPEMLIIQAEILKLEGQFTEAFNLSSDALKSYPENPEIAALYADLGLNSYDVERQGIALAKFWNSAQGEAMPSLLALRELAKWDGMEPEHDAWIAVKLRDHPLAKVPDWLQSLSIRLRIGEPRKEIETEAMGMFDRTRINQLAMAAEWLTKEGFYESVLALIPVETARAREDLFHIRAKAFVDGKRANELNQWLQKETSSVVSSAEMNTWQAIVYYHMDRMPEARHFWQAAIGAVDTPKQLLNIAGLLSDYEVHEWLLEVSERLARIKGFQRIAADLSVEALHAAGDAEELMNYYNTMQTAYPKEAFPQIQYAYLRLLLKQDMQSAYKSAETLAAAYPTLASARLLDGFAQWQKGLYKVGYERIEDVDWREMTDSDQAIALLLAVSDENYEAAQKWSVGLSPDKILDAEKDELKNVGVAFD